MKKLGVLVLCVVGMVTCLAGCQKAKTEADQEIRIDKDTVTITLDENPTTGFTWQYAVEPKDGLAFVKDEFIQTNKDEKMVGAGGQHVFQFKAQKAGNVTLKFEYRRAWEKVEAEETRIYQLKIDDQLKVTMD